MSDKRPPEQLIMPALQPWLSTKPVGEALDEKRAAARSSLLKALADSNFATIEQRVCLILRDFPETRDSDTALLIRYWRKFQSDILLEWRPFQMEALFDLEKMESISRARRHVQNDLELFQATPRTLSLRGEAQIELHQYLATRHEGAPELRFYLDETGNDPQSRFTGIGGICILDWRQFEMQHEALKYWRDKQGWPETLHFNKVTTDIGPYLKLLAELKKRRAGILFTGYAAPARRNKQEMYIALIGQLVTDALKRAESLGCLNSPRTMTIIKEREDGFDALYLKALEASLHELLARDFPGRVYLEAVTPMPKGREVLLECADIIASGMYRREVSGGRHSKDVLAEAVMNTAGFEDSNDPGALYRYFTPK
ncbi:DUF3800 domain-containing protein [Corallococcus sp. 4LFB]|uniref:DUF3800 domain-containing protein n=1 Tax=Corallococcus sp. 4LFB TaxID=3383249 RepID=UPI0039756DE9